MDFSTVRDNVRSDVFKNQLPYPKGTSYKPDHIFIEHDDKPVTWHREEVKRLNDELRAKKDAYRDEDNRLQDEYRSQLIAAIIDDLSIAKHPNAEDIASKVYHKAWEDGHSAGYEEVISHASELSDMVGDILNLLEGKKC